MSCPFPFICHHYNNRTGCRDSIRCPYLHVCKLYVWDIPHHPRCNLDHELSPHDKVLLSSLGINVFHANILNFIVTFCAGQHPPRSPYGPISCHDLRPRLELPKPCRFYDSPFNDNSEVQCKLGKTCKFLHICSNLETSNASYCYKCEGTLRHTPTRREMSKLWYCCFETVDPLKALKMYKTIIQKFALPVQSLDLTFRPSSPLSAVGISSRPSTSGFVEPNPCKRHETKPCFEVSCPMFRFRGDVMWCIRKISANQKLKIEWDRLPESTVAELEGLYSDPHIDEALFNWNGGKYKVIFSDSGPVGESASHIEFLRLYYENSYDQHWTWYWEEDVRQNFPGSAFPKLLKDFYNFEDDIKSWVAYGEPGRTKQTSSIGSQYLENLYNLTASFPNFGRPKTFTAASQSYSIDLQNLTQVNVQSGKMRSICRRPSIRSPKRKDFAQPTEMSIRVPSWFSDTLKNPIVERLSDSDGDGRVLSLFVEKNVPNLKSVKIFRIQNGPLWRKFYVTRMEMRNKFKKGGLNEALLFHGTSPDSVIKIVEQNFDCRLSGSKFGEVLGAGSYFSPDFGTALKYSGEGRAKFIFIGLVLMGDFTLGRKGYRRPPEKPKGGLYDSCVDKLDKPTKVAIFDNNQCYPLYYMQIETLQSILKKI